MSDTTADSGAAIPPLTPEKVRMIRECAEHGWFALDDATECLAAKLARVRSRSYAIHPRDGCGLVRGVPP